MVLRPSLQAASISAREIVHAPHLFGQILQGQDASNSVFTGVSRCCNSANRRST